MTFLIQQTLIYAVPLMIVALAGVFAERSGIINLALEGIMIFGAFIGVLFVRNAIFMGAFTNIPDEADPKYAGSRIEWVRDKNAYAKAVTDELKYQKRLGNSPFLAEVQRLNDKYDKVRLAAGQDYSRNVKEERQRRQAEENAW